MALALVIGCVTMIQEPVKVPELPSYTDPVLEVSIEDEETPLAAAPKVTTKTTKKTTKKNVKLKTAASKTYTKKLPTTKKTTNKTQNKTNETISIQTTVLTAKTEKYTKKSNIKVVSTTVTTTVKTTTTSKTNDTFTSAVSNSNVSTVKSTGKTGKYETDVAKLTPLMDGRVVYAYEKLGFKLMVDSSVSYAGHFDARTRTITLQMEDDTVYHELGHFLAFITGNTDKSSSFVEAYNQEKSKFTGVNKAYATQNSSEYFAESMKDYCLNPGALKSARPKTYAALTQALNIVTDAQVQKVLTLYAPVWK